MTLGVNLHESIISISIDLPDFIEFLKIGCEFSLLRVIEESDDTSFIIVTKT